MSFPRKRESRNGSKTWMPASAGMTTKQLFRPSFTLCLSWRSSRLCGEILLIVFYHAAV